MGKEGLSLEAPVDWSGLAWHCRLPSFWAEGGRSMTSPPRFLLRRDKEQRGAGGGWAGLGNLVRDRVERRVSAPGLDIN